MKKIFIRLIVSLLSVVFLTSLVGCEFLDLLGDKNDNGNGGNNGGLPQIDNEIDLETFTPTPDDDNDYVDGEDYFISESVSLVTEVNGNYSINRPFTLDKENENKRIYHNIYFYEEDYFQVIYYKNVNDLGVIYASLSDQTDTEYAKIKYTEKGNPLQIDIIKKGVYNLILDIETFAIDMVKIGDIDQPVYETIKTCELAIHISGSSSIYTEMTLDSDTNEYYIQKEIPRNASIGFYSASHNSCYKMTVESELHDTLLYWNFQNKTSVNVHVGGTYKIYFNAKTYVLRLELQNPDTAKYYCQVEWKKGNVLSPKSNSQPYLFEYEFVAQGEPSRPYVDLPSFYPELGMSYNLTLVDDYDLTVGDSVKEDGTYKLTINLKNYTLSVEKI